MNLFFDTGALPEDLASFAEEEWPDSQPKRKKPFVCFKKNGSVNVDGTLTPEQAKVIYMVTKRAESNN